MSSLNRVILVGRLGSAPELRNTQTGIPVCSFSVATSEKSAKGESTEWHRIVVWQKQAENCAKYLSKGSQVCIEGRLQTRAIDKEAKRYMTEIVAQNVQFLSTKEISEDVRPVSTPADSSAVSDASYLDDTPF